MASFFNRGTGCVCIFLLNMSGVLAHSAPTAGHEGHFSILDAHPGRPTLVPGVDFTANLKGALTANTLSDFARNIQRSFARAGDDSQKLLPVYLLVNATLENNPARRTQLLNDFPFHVGGKLAAEVSTRLRTMINKEGGSSPTALEALQKLQAQMQANGAIASSLARFLDGAAERASQGGNVAQRPYNFVLVNAGRNPERMQRIIADPDFPKHADVFTNELSLARHELPAYLGTKARRVKAIRIAQRSDSLFTPYMELARKKDLRIWLGHPLLENGRLYNAYSLITAHGIAYTQRKKFLWKTEDVKKQKGGYVDAADRWEGNFKHYAILICSEVEAFYNILRWDRPSLVPELREAQPRLVVVPAHWLHFTKFFEKEARVVARPLWQKNYKKNGKDFSVIQGVRPEGVFVFGVNAYHTFVMGPAGPEQPSRRVIKLGALNSPGWIQVIGNIINIVKRNL